MAIGFAAGQRRLARRVETLEGDVSKLEAELATVRADLVGHHAGDWQKLHALAERERELDTLLARRITEWEAASAAALKVGIGCCGGATNPNFSNGTSEMKNTDVPPASSLP